LGYGSERAALTILTSKKTNSENRLSVLSVSIINLIANHFQLTNFKVGLLMIAIEYLLQQDMNCFLRNSGESQLSSFDEISRILIILPDR
jgi:hypothetical protein